MTIHKLFDDKFVNMESRIENLIERKLGEKMDAIAMSNETNAQQSDNKNIETTKKHGNFSEIVTRGVIDFKKVMEEAENEKRLEEREQGKRSMNFIIHGMKEQEDNNDEIKKNDEDILKRFLEKVDSDSIPVSVAGLGKPNESKKRTIIVMANYISKAYVMQNLKRLKGSEIEFGKLRVTDDYTLIERELIRSWVKKAEEKTTDDSEFDYRVRGDPKKGLHQASFPKVARNP